MLLFGFDLELWCGTCWESGTFRSLLDGGVRQVKQSIWHTGRGGLSPLTTLFRVFSSPSLKWQRRLPMHPPLRIRQSFTNLKADTPSTSPPGLGSGSGQLQSKLSGDRGRLRSRWFTVQIPVLKEGRCPHRAAKQQHPSVVQIPKMTCICITLTTTKGQITSQAKPVTAPGTQT